MELPSRKYKPVFQRVFKSFLKNTDPFKMVIRNVSLDKNILKIGKDNVELKKIRNIYVAAIGKCAVKMFKGLEKILGDLIRGGIIISSDSYSSKKERVLFVTGDHPIPGKKSFYAGKIFLNFLDSVKEKDLLIALISGGSSAMVTGLPDAISRDSFSLLNRLLLRSGASIEEINCVRKHCSTIKGGLSAKNVFPAKVLNMVISDTSDSSPSTIGSGPFAWDDTTFQDSIGILEKYKLTKNISEKIIKHFENGIRGIIDETPSSDSKMFQNNLFFVLGNNRFVLNNMKNELEENGISCHILSSGDSGNIHIKAKEFASVIEEKYKEKETVKHPLLLMSGGEYTSEIKGNGRGGRNMEFMLSVLNELNKFRGKFFAFSFGSDGIDGPTDAAGAWIDENTSKKSNRLNNKSINFYLKNSDSYTFFNKIDQLIKIGPTGTNLMDIRGVFIP